jgi:outer membrane protein
MTQPPSRLLAAALVLIAACFGPNSRSDADETPGNALRLGFYDVFYHASAQDIAGPYVPAGLNVTVKDVQTLYVGYIRRLARQWEIELAFGIPPTTNTYGKGPATVGSVPYNGVLISSAKWFAPTALLNYKFLDETYPVRPYIGAGINYTYFYDRQSTAGGNAVSGGPTSISLPSSIGPAATVGIGWQVAHHCTVNASYSFSQVKTELSADTAGIIRTTHVSFGPEALVIAVGYQF